MKASERNARTPRLCPRPFPFAGALSRRGGVRNPKLDSDRKALREGERSPANAPWPNLLVHIAPAERGRLRFMYARHLDDDGPITAAAVELSIRGGDDGNRGSDSGCEKSEARYNEKEAGPPVKKNGPVLTAFLMTNTMIGM